MGSYHALLIGIDAYDATPCLSGSVNDVDALAQILPSIAPLPARVVSLVSPQRGHRVLRTDESLPTRANIISALQEMSRQIQLGDRVLVYYSGHGTWAFVPEALGFREALVPMDYNNGSGLLWDVEISGFLDALYAACGDITVILDACFAAGATRWTGSTKELTPRRLLLTNDQMRQLTPPNAELLRGCVPTRGLVARYPTHSYTVVAAAHSFQVANERRFPDGSFGLLTHALLKVWRKERPEVLHKLRWADVWSRICQDVWDTSEPQAPQQPVLIGPRANCMFGGPPGPVANGIIVRQGQDPGSYKVEAGRLFGAGEGARIAVYSELPASFPAPGSIEEQSLNHLGDLRVISATEFESEAVPLANSAPFVLPPTACGRLVAMQAEQRLKVAIDPTLTEDLRTALLSHAAEDSIEYQDGERQTSEAYLGQYPNGSVWLGDPTYRPDPENLTQGLGPLVLIERSDLSTMLLDCRAVLRHYSRYVIPLRMARHSHSDATPKPVEIEVISCPSKRMLEQLIRQPGIAHPLPRDAFGRVNVKPGDKVTFAINNFGIEDLHFVLFNCSADGRIERLDTDCSTDINGESRKFLGMIDEDDPGTGLQPFVVGMSADTGYSCCIDRLVAFVTNHRRLIDQMVKLELCQSFADSRDTARRKRFSSTKGLCGPANLIWFATKLDVFIGRRPTSENPRESI